MVSSQASTVEQYLDELSPDRREMVATLLEIIDAAIPDGFIKEMRWGMVSYSVPLEVSGPTYNGQPLTCVAVASQKNYVSVYLMSVYASPELTKQFESRWVSSGRKLNMGKSCVRLKTMADADLDAISWAVAEQTPSEFTEIYVAARN